MTFRSGRRRWFAPLCLLALMLLLASPALAHGGEPGHAPGALTPWLVALTYLQMFMAPIVGVWLLREAIAAWRAPAGGADRTTFKGD